MANVEQIAEELRHRIEDDAAYFGGNLPEREAIAWRGYLAALLEWNVIPTSAYEGLLQLVPAVASDPAVSILHGRE